MTAPDHVKCVLTGRYDIPAGAPGGPRKERKTWCGKVPEVFEWAFLDTSHAILHCNSESFLLICPKCSAAIKEALEDGTA